jgi:hypothetical protein
LTFPVSWGSVGEEGIKAENKKGHRFRNPFKVGSGARI